MQHLRGNTDQNWTDDTCFQEEERRKPTGTHVGGVGMRWSRESREFDGGVKQTEESIFVEVWRAERGNMALLIATTQRLSIACEEA